MAESLKLINAIESNFTWFCTERESVIPKLLGEINKLLLNERFEYFQKIKHNNLLMLDWCYGNSRPTTKLIPDKFINPNNIILKFSYSDDNINYLDLIKEVDKNTHIYTHEQFIKTFDKSVYQMYLDINKSNISANMRLFIMLEMIKKIVLLKYSNAMI